MLSALLTTAAPQSLQTLDEGADPSIWARPEPLNKEVRFVKVTWLPEEF